MNLKTICDSIKNLFETIRPAAPLFPAIIMACSLAKRPGLSAIALTSAIIRRLPEAGIETGVNPDGSENKIGKIVRIVCEETIKEFKDNARVTCVIEPGSIIGTGTGASPVGPIVVSTINTMIGRTIGLIQ